MASTSSDVAHQVTPAPSVLASELLDRIDSVRKLGVNHLISLPQIAVVGDQSAGKSSLLEAISGISFPKDKEMCTTFATQIVMAKGASFAAKVTIDPDPSNISVGLPVPKSPLDVAAVIEEAKNLMSEGNSNLIIADKILTIELTGPNYPRLTLVDLPGYVQSVIKGQSETIIEDIADIVDRHLKDERTITLAVIPANKDLATNVVVGKVDKLGSNGARTLGVITKVDVIDAGEEEAVLEILHGRRCDFGLGFHAVRNRNWAEVNGSLSTEELLVKEAQFFARAPWSQLDKSMKGIVSLRSKLVEILHNHVEKELPGLTTELHTILDGKTAELRRLGDAITTDTQKRMLLITNARDFMKSYEAFVDGLYTYATTNPKTEFFLRARLQALNEKFYESILRHIGDTLEKAAIEQMIKEFRGRELAGFPLYHAFIQLVRINLNPWLDIATKHVEATCTEVQKTLRQLVQDVVHPTLVRAFTLVADTFVHTIKDGMMAEVLEMHIDERTPLTYNHYYTQHKVTASNKEYDIEDMILHVKAYLKTASKKFIDAVCMYAIERRLFRLGIPALSDALLGIDPGVIKESMQVVQTRNKLQGEITKLREALSVFY
ncbi:P-loop containing nucleoside triphosphate hydrolase protein [Gonapodya prolifera JEL478]|uniref:p-loop containing nucleoside triphosphate hydrolase protein n=1 Tax=Gonapodya prolifera (strain JEL478) TaxID=1344416 RepID=A0A139AMI3_GONPJ|nr:P-loop containing nucleoside triphosphate hydrolase protein [Gonapodya prolifera JEL478]|eukprot:KXS17655.1 P-loop containing nucleoside triphosphate hydrolase protein [Gonapodya prolifera JEL478]